MKFLPQILFTLIVNGLTAQTVDTITVKNVDSLIQVSRDLMKKLDYDSAYTIQIMASKLAIEKLGKVSASYGKCCSSLGRLHLFKGETKEAEKYYLEYTNIMEQALGNHHPDYAWSLDDLAQLYHHFGQFEKAEDLYKQSGIILEKVYGKMHPEYAWSLNDLAILYKDLAYYEKAETLYLEAKTIRENTLGKQHSDYAWSLNNLANLYMVMGQYDKAEPLYMEAKSIWEKKLGREHSSYASSLNNMAALYFNIGDLKKAEIYFAEAVEIRGKTLGKEHPEYLSSLDNLASVFMTMGDYQSAEPLYVEAKTIREKVLGKDHPEWATSVGNLAILYKNLNQPERADTLFHEALRLWELTVGKEHPNYATVVNNLANFYYDNGQFEKAERLFIESKAIRLRLFGNKHPDYSESLGHLAKLQESLGRFSEAEKLIKEFSSINQSLLAKACTFLSEYELGQYSLNFHANLDDFCSYAFKRLASSVKTPLGLLPSLIYDHALFYKGFLLNATIQIKKLALSDAVTAEQFNLLKSYERRLAAHYSTPLSERDDSSAITLEAEANDLNKKITRSVAGYGEIMKQVTWEEVQAALHTGEAAIEFIKYNYLINNAIGTAQYAVLLLKHGEKWPQFIPLFEEKSLDSLLQSDSERKADYVNGLYTLADRGAIAMDKPKRSLYEILWQRLEKELDGIKTIYFSPSGLLHRINLDAIPVNETETLADQYQLIELNSTRQLVIPGQIKKVNNDAVLYGGIQFEPDSSIQNNEPLLASRSRGELSFSSVDSTIRGGSWNYLVGTEREVNAIEKIMQSSSIQTDIKKGNAATEEAFKKIGTNNHASPRILHIATHGYFFSDDRTVSARGRMAHDPDSIGTTSEETAIAASPKPKVEFETSEPVFKISEHPMLRSGLIMAGGNAAWQGKQTAEGREDGILTAYEISQMNLSNTELVVLSACETGLGDIQGNEGVYGMQRAFKIAGAKYLIMSLWQVPDKQTSLLMTTFYKKWLGAEGPDAVGKKMTIPNAFHAAQKELRNLGLDPYQWAGFVLVE